MPSASPPPLTDDELHTLETILGKLSGPGADLPWPLFRFLTEIAATPNVDLLVRDPGRGVLLSWRDDPFGRGWHVPGSIIRHREEIGHRIAECAREEFGCQLDVASGPCALVQIFDDRGHSVSLCFAATLAGVPGKRVVSEGEIPDAGDLCWFKAAPEVLYPSHLVYSDVIAFLAEGVPGQARLFTQHAGGRDAAQPGRGGVISADASLT